MSTKLVLANIPAIQIGHETSTDQVIQNGLVQSATSKESLNLSLGQLSRGYPTPLSLSSSAVKLSHSWLGGKAPKLNFCSAIFFYKRFLTLVVDQGYHR
jgi:hypothetical protein